jgi:hypothetical protein
MKAHKARIRRMNMYGVKIGFGINLILLNFISLILDITVSPSIVERFCP